MADETIEKEAKAMGWVPKDEFRGNPDLWKDADEFVKDGNEILPILRERLKKVTSVQDETLAKLTKTESLLQTLTEHHKKTEESAYQRALKELKSQQRAAIEDSDVEAYDRLDKEIESLEKPKNTDTPELDPGFITWKSENQWYDTRTDMAMYADSVAAFVEKRNPGLKGKPFFDKVTEEVKARFPNEFENPNRKKPDAVEGGGGDNNTGSQKKKAKGYSDLPQDAKEACDELVRGGVMKKEQYVKEYWELLEA